MSDPVNSPAHYTGDIETIDFIKDKLGCGFRPYCIGNALKYISRAGKKGGEEKFIEDIQKAITYLEWSIGVDRRKK